MSQKCSRCKKDKTFEEFNKKRDGSYTKQCSRCLDCSVGGYDFFFLGKIR